MLTSAEIAAIAAKALDDKKARDIKVLKTDKQTVLADYFVICNGTSSTHIKALVDEVDKQLSEAGEPPIRREGLRSDIWVLMDFGCVIVHVFTDDCCEAREAGSMLASIARTHAHDGKNLAFLMGGETVVHLRGKGLGGRNQEIALSAALGIEGLSNALVFSVGSDGTDGPTDAAGGIADGETAQLMRQKGVDAVKSLNDNDACHALGAVGGLLKTGATGTNVNDVTVLLLRTSE